MSEVILSKDIKLDAKHRLTVKKPVADHYRMTCYDDGRIVLEPMELISVQEVERMREAVERVKNGEKGEPVNMSEVLAILEE